MERITFLSWLENNKQDFINGKTDKFTLTSKTRLGHIPHTSGGGAHDSRPNKQRTRQGQANAWKKQNE